MEASCSLVNVNNIWLEHKLTKQKYDANNNRSFSHLLLKVEGLEKTKKSNTKSEERVLKSSNLLMNRFRIVLFMIFLNSFHQQPTLWQIKRKIKTI